MAQVGRGIARPVLVVAGLGTFLAQLDGTVMNVALPTLSHAFRTARISSVQPVITAYLVAIVSLLPLLGKLADRWGRRRLFLAGFGVFGLASILCALATSLALLVVFRVVQALGGALLSGTSLALVAGSSGERRGASLGKLAVVFALSGLLGPPVGGGLIQAFGWQAVFWLNAPLCLIGIALGVWFLPPDQPSRALGGIDVPGPALFAAGTALLTAAAATAGGNGLQLGPIVVAWPALLAGGLLAYGALLLWEASATRRGLDPLLHTRLLRTPAYGLGLLVAFLSSGVTIALFVLVPFWLTKGWHMGAATLGVIFLPVALGLGAIAPIAGKRSDAAGPRLLTTCGMLAGGAAALLLAWQATALVWPVLVASMFLLGTSSGLFAAPNNNAVLAAAPATDLAAASSLLSAARTLGVILGVGAFGASFDALRASEATNPAARSIFLAAAALFCINALLCWQGRPAPAPAPSRAEQPPRQPAHPPAGEGL